MQNNNPSVCDDMQASHPVSALPAASVAGLLDLLQTPACWLDAAGEILHLNAAWRRHAGIPASHTVAGSWMRLVVAEDRAAAAAQLLSAFGTGECSEFECRVQDGAGGFRWFLLSLQPCWEGDGQPACLCVATDVHALKLREQELHMRSRMHAGMLNVSVDCIKLVSTQGRLIHMNRAGCLALGVPEDSAFGMEWVPLLPAEVRQLAARALEEARNGLHARFPGRSELPGQAPQYWDNMLTPVKDARGGTIAILCVSREVTAERRAQESLRQGQERLAIAARVGGLGVWDYDLANDRLHCDEAWYRIMGRDPNEPIRSIGEFRPLIHPDDVERATEVRQAAADVIASHGNYGVVFRVVWPGGEIRWVRSAASVIQDDAGVPVRAVGFVVDITDARRGELALRDANRVLEEEKQSLARQNLEDALTGVANRRHLDRELARICMQAMQHPEPVAIAMVDVDYFKAYNDHYGHQKGDDALRGVATALQSTLGEPHFVARYGGEEFVVVFPGMMAPEPMLARLHAAVEASGIPHAGSPLGRVTISCGCVVFHAGGDLVPAGLLRACDEALYEAKAGGRNRHVVHARVTSGAGL